MGRDSAVDPIRFIENLTHPKGRQWAGRPFTLKPWQKRDIIRPMFACGKDGRRTHRTCLIMLPRKNGKSALMAAVGLYMLIADGEPGAEVYIAATDREQASLIFSMAARMIRQDARLSGLCQVVDSQKRIVYPLTGSVLRAISAEAPHHHGFSASCVIYDELHAAPNRELWDVLTTSTGARDQPLVVAISTAGTDRHSLLYELYAHAQSVRAGTVSDPTFMSAIWEAPAEADWTDEAVWQAANPALGDFRSLEEMRVACDRAKAIPAQQNAFRRLYLNQWTETETRWFDLAVWDACGGAIDLEALRGRPCYGGLDLASTSDLTAFVLVFPGTEAGEPAIVIPTFWVPEESLLKRVQKDRVPYDQWRDTTWYDWPVLRVTRGSATNYDEVRQGIRELAELYEIKGIAYDRWQAIQLVTQLEEDGAACFPMGQGMASMSGPTKEVERLILTGQICHGDHPLLRWNAGNVTLEQDAAGNIKPSKKKSHEKIDGMVALIEAVDLMAREQYATSIYDESEVFVV